MQREPVHVFYAGAHLMKPGLLEKLKTIAVNTLRQFEPGAWRVEQRLQAGVIEDLRIDFEDGFGVRSGAEEDSFALSAGKFTADAGALPACWGVRIKALSPTTAPRALQTLELFTQAGVVPPVITLPKIQSQSEVETLVRWLESRQLASRIELMVETVYSLGALPELIEACAGRCTALHFGAYDFLSELGIAWPDQTLTHSFCDQARFAMQRAVALRNGAALPGVVTMRPALSMDCPGSPPNDAFLHSDAVALHSDAALSNAETQRPVSPPNAAAQHGGAVALHGGDSRPNTGASTSIRVVDGVTSLLPLGDQARAGWDLHQANIRHSLAQGFFASWDVHPAQVAARYAALYRYFDQHKAALGARLANFAQQQAQATRVGAAFDDAATVRGLARFFTRAVDCGALAPEELPELTGLPLAALGALC